MKNLKNIIYILTCLCVSVIIGAAVYEHMVVWPTAYSAPPLSLAMFQGEFGLDGSKFWTKIHPVTLIFFVATLILFWKTKRRINVLIAFGGYLAIIIITSIYFVPELIDIISTEYSTNTDVDLQNRGSLWISLSLLRLGLLIILSVFLTLGLTKNTSVE